MMRAVASARVGGFSSLAKARPLGRRTVRPSQILSWPRVGAFAALQSTIRYESKADMALSYSIVCHLSGLVMALIDRTSVLTSCCSDERQSRLGRLARLIATSSAAVLNTCCGGDRSRRSRICAAQLSPCFCIIPGTAMARHRGKWTGSRTQRAADVLSVALGLAEGFRARPHRWDTGRRPGNWRGEAGRRTEPMPVNVSYGGRRLCRSAQLSPWFGHGTHGFGARCADAMCAVNAAWRFGDGELFP